MEKEKEKGNGEGKMEVIREEIRIKMENGDVLFGKLWRPTVSYQVPCVLEYIPYGCGVFTVKRDEQRLAYFASQGIACCRVDMRGAGDSTGLYYDEYLPQEQQDAVKIIETLANSKWCTGSIAMYGKSWAGFNGLQVAALQPKGLDCVVSLYSTVDRYEDDIHYYGGLFNASGHVPWGAVMLAYNARPPQRGFEEGWEEIWMERMKKIPSFFDTWVKKQTKSEYWHNGSIRYNCQNINIPIYSIQGVSDGYTDTTFKIKEIPISSPVKCLLGPWGHDWPDQAEPGPRIGYLQEVTRYLKKHLKGCHQDNNQEKEDDVVVFVQDGGLNLPSRKVKEVKGKFVTLPSSKPSSLDSLEMNVRWGKREVFFGKDEGENGEEREHFVDIPFHLASGIDAGDWLGWGSADLAGSPPCQREEIQKTMWCCSPALSSPLVVVGLPRVKLTVKVDRPVAQLFIRLLHFDPSSPSSPVTMITRGAYNLNHHLSSSSPTPLPLHQPLEISFSLNTASYLIPAGHSLGISLSSSAFPLLWPPPAPVCISVSECSISLPTLDYNFYLSSPTPPRLDTSQFPPFCLSSSDYLREISPGKPAGRLVERDLITGSHTITLTQDFGEFEVIETGMKCWEKEIDRWIIQEGDPTSAVSESEVEVRMAHKGIEIGVVGKIEMRCGEKEFQVTTSLRGSKKEDGKKEEVVYERNESYEVPRLFM